ncbi:Abhydrolase domain-containing protein C22H12.03, partial [Termitomyces sp. T112]
MLLRFAFRRVSAKNTQISLNSTAASCLEIRSRAAPYAHSNTTRLSGITRLFSNVQSQSQSVIDLDYATQIPPNGNAKEGALVILHGLFGSKRNFTSLAKQLMKDLNIPIYSLDLRNQGTSPHSEPMTYSAMADDVLHFIKAHSLSNVTLLGHSMGGKAAMSVALHPFLSDARNTQVLSKLIVVDVAPTRAELSPEFKGYVAAMQKIERLKLRTRKEALEVLEEYEPDMTVRQFLLTNLNPLTQSEPFATFRVPLNTLGAAIPEIGSFPYAPGERQWTGPSLFIKGSQSA